MGLRGKNCPAPRSMCARLFNQPSHDLLPRVSDPCSPAIPWAPTIIIHSNICILGLHGLPASVCDCSIFNDHRFCREGRFCFDLFEALHATVWEAVQSGIHKLYFEASVPATLCLAVVCVVPISAATGFGPVSLAAVLFAAPFPLD